MRAAVLLALVACGDNVPPDPNVAQSGARLHLVQYDYGDGAREIDRAQFHDAARDERCSPQVWSDGVTRCTPAFTDAVFATDECIEPLGRVPEGDTPPPYVMRQYWLRDHWLPSRMFVTGNTVPAPTAVYELRGPACVGPFDGTGFRYVAAGAEVLQDDLVRITHPAIPTTSRLALEVIASEDGLYAPVGWRDGEVPCTAMAAAGEPSTVCVPEAVASASYFHDAQCTEPELAMASGDELPTVIRYRDERTSCTRYHDLGTEVVAPPLFHENGPSCVSIAAPSDERYFLLGAPSDLATLARERDPTARRVHPIALVQDQLRLGDVHVYDEMLGTECRRTEIDGVVRCVPATATPVIELFSDDACHAVVSLAEVHTGTCAIADAFAREGVQYRRIAAVHSMPLFHLSTGDRCLPYAPADGIELHDVGPIEPASAFAAATLVVGE